MIKGGLFLNSLKILPEIAVNHAVQTPSFNKNRDSRFSRNVSGVRKQRSESKGCITIAHSHQMSAM